MTNNDILKKRMIEALTKALGVVSSACQACKISRETHYRWMREDPQYKDACHDIKEVSLDFVESKLFKNINDNKEASIFYYLNNKGASRGYSRDYKKETKETSTPVQININTNDKILPSNEEDVE